MASKRKLTEIDWDKAAKAYVKGEKELLKQQNPRGYGVTVNWRDGDYLGSLQHVALQFYPDIVLLSKTSDPLSPEYIGAISRQQPKRERLTADSNLDLEGRLHFLRRVEDRLTKMTPKQTTYMQNNLPAILETNTGIETVKVETHLYS